MAWELTRRVRPGLWEVNMRLNEARTYAPVEVVTQAAKDLGRRRGESHEHGHGNHRHGVRTLRQADHKGHHIEVVTSYEIQVDGRRLDALLNVDNDGRVTCHAVPNYISFSALDVVKRLVDAYPDSFIPQGDSAGEQAHGQGEHQ
jgi:hypothetical protein